MSIENSAPIDKDRAAVENRRALVFAAALATIFMGAVEATIVATAMPAIVHSLGDFGLFSWTFGAYLLAQAVTIPIYGRLADVYGRKTVLLIGIAIFLAGSALCALAWSMIALIAFRAVQGIGAGSLVPIAQTIVGDIYSGPPARPDARLYLERVRERRHFGTTPRRRPRRRSRLAGGILD